MISRSNLKHLVLAGLLLTSANGFGHGTAAQADRTARAIEFPNIEGFQTLVVDLHTHSVFSDGHVWPKIRVEEGIRDGLDGLAITEHLEFQPHRADILHPDRNRAIDEARTAAEGSDLLIIPGSEITRDAPAGHMNAVFITDANALLNVPNPPEDPSDVMGYYDSAKEWPAQNAVDAAHAQGAFIFWNHPYWTRHEPDGIAKMNSFHRANAKAGKLHGIEIANGQTYSEEAHALAIKHDLTFIGVSDIHDLIDWDHPPGDGEHRPVNLVFSSTRTLEGIKEALFAQRTVVWFRNFLIGREDALMPLLDASIEVISATYVPDTQLLRVEVANHSDATFYLTNRSKVTFMTATDTITLPAHETSTFTLKPGRYASEVKMKFDVLNALTKPKSNPSLTLTFAPELPETSEG